MLPSLMYPPIYSVSRVLLHVLIVTIYNILSAVFRHCSPQLYYRTVVLSIGIFTNSFVIFVRHVESISQTVYKQYADLTH